MSSGPYGMTEEESTEVGVVAGVVRRQREGLAFRRQRWSATERRYQRMDRTMLFHLLSSAIAREWNGLSYQETCQGCSCRGLASRTTVWPGLHASALGMHPMSVLKKRAETGHLCSTAHPKGRDDQATQCVYRALYLQSPSASPVPKLQSSPSLAETYL